VPVNFIVIFSIHCKSLIKELVSEIRLMDLNWLFLYRVLKKLLKKQWCQVNWQMPQVLQILSKLSKWTFSIFKRIWLFISPKNVSLIVGSHLKCAFSKHPILATTQFELIRKWFSLKDFFQSTSHRFWHSEEV
jgi:hypothetical protein